MTKTVSFHGHEAESLRMFNEKISIWQKIDSVETASIESIANFIRFCIFRHQARFYQDTKEETIKAFTMELLLHFNSRCTSQSYSLGIMLFFDFLECDRVGNLKKKDLPYSTKENRDLKSAMLKFSSEFIIYPYAFNGNIHSLSKDLFAILSLWKVLNKKPKFNTDSFITKFLETLNAE